MAKIEFTTEELESEEWRPIAGYEALYEVSNLGRIRKLFTTSKGFTRLAGSILKLNAPSKRYPMVGIQGKCCAVHRLVATAFLGERPSGLQINHIDGNRCNPRATNLEYVTCRENILHAIRLGLSNPRTNYHRGLKGEEHPHAKLSEKQVIEIRRSLLNGRKGKDIAAEMNITAMNVTDIKHGRLWKHLQPLKAELADHIAQKRRSQRLRKPTKMRS